MKINSVRNQFMIILLPLFVLSFSILSGISYYVANTELQKKSNEISASIGDVLAAQIDKEISQKMIRLEELASNSLLIHGDEATKISILADAKKRSPEFDMISYTDINGQALNEKGLKMDRASREYIKKVRETKRPYVSNPSISGANGNLIVILTQPILENGNLTGFIYGTISLESISKLCQDAKFMNNGYAYIADSTGLVIGHGSDAAFIGKANLTKKGSENDIPLDESLIEGFQHAMNTKAQTVMNYRNTQNIETCAVITPLELQGRTWMIFSVAPLTEIEASSIFLSKVLSGISILFILLAAWIIYIFINRVSSPIEAIAAECGIINQGDLRRPDLVITSNNEIGKLANGFNQMRRSLRSLLEKVKDQSESLASSSEQLTASASQSAEAAGQIAVSIVEISNGAEKQTEAADQMTAKIERIFVTAKEISDKSDSIVQVAENTTNTAESGRSSIAKAVEQMRQISEGSSEIQNSVAQLAKGSQEIRNIVELISNIAGQTNLLALNAAIEAARAGEAGKGFAVVAEEVRKLAEESNQSSKKIAELVLQNQNDMEKAVQASRAGSQSISLGIEAVESADDTFKTIVAAISELLSEIAAVSQNIRHMTEGSNSMLTAVHEINAVSKNNTRESQSVSAATEEQAASMEEIASSSKILARFAADLQVEISKFKV